MKYQSLSTLLEEEISFSNGEEKLIYFQHCIEHYYLDNFTNIPSITDNFKSKSARVIVFCLICSVEGSRGGERMKWSWRLNYATCKIVDDPMLRSRFAWTRIGEKVQVCSLGCSN